MSLTFKQPFEPILASNSSISEFEQLHKFNLPSEYRNFLLTINGGSPSLSWCSFEGDGDFISYFYSIQNENEHVSLHKQFVEFAEAPSPNFLPIAESNGGNLFLLKLTEDDVGSIYFWNHELEDIAPPTFYELVKVSDSFSSFLELLAEDPD